MTPAKRGRSDGEPSTRDALMDAALEQLRSKGALAGLNLREIADAVGVTPANIYYFFGDRQGLLRAAISRELDRLAATAAELASVPFADRRTRMFDAIMQRPDLRLSALLALDGDPDFEPLPFLEMNRELWRRQRAAGQLPEEVDIESIHLVSVAMTIGLSIYGEAAARQLGIDTAELVARSRDMVERMVHLVLDDAAGESGTPPQR